MSSSSATPPTIPGSLNVDTAQVNKVLKIVDMVVGDALSSLNTWKGAVDAATTADITLSGEQTVDGIALVAGDKVLVKDQATGTENGLYIVEDTAWYRSDDMVEGSSAGGSAVFVKQGTANDNQVFVCTNDPGSDIVGTDGLVFANLNATISAAGADTQVQFNSGGSLAADAGFTYDGAGAVASTVSMTSPLIDDGAGSTMAAGVVTGVTLTDGTFTSTAGIAAGTNLTASALLTATDGTNTLQFNAAAGTFSGTDATTNIISMDVNVPNFSVTDGTDTITVTPASVAMVDANGTSSVTAALLSMQATSTVGFYGAAPVAQHSSTGDVTGFAANTSGIVDGTAAVVGASGATAYTMGDIVTALKAYGLMAP